MKVKVRKVAVLRGEFPECDPEKIGYGARVRIGRVVYDGIMRSLQTKSFRDYLDAQGIDYREELKLSEAWKATNAGAEEGACQMEAQLGRLACGA